MGNNKTSVEELQQQMEAQLASYPPTLNPIQIAEILGVTRRYVDKMLERGEMNWFTIDPNATYKQKRVLKATLIAFMIDRQSNNYKEDTQHE